MAGREVEGRAEVPHPRPSLQGMEPIPITLSALDPNQVASATNFEVLFGAPATRLLILPGIAVPEF